MAEVDARYAELSSTHRDLAEFRGGVSLISQWTGSTYKNMEKVFLGAIVVSADREVVIAVRAVLDFVYLARLATHTEASLEQLDRSWRLFHQHKEAFVTEGASANFDNIPKLHSMFQYNIASIRSVCTLTLRNVPSRRPTRTRRIWSKRSCG